MIPITKIENSRGDVLNLSTDPRYMVTVAGTSPPAATINTSKVALNDGEKFNSSTVGKRNLVLTIHILRDAGRARLNLYRYIAAKAFIRVYYQTPELETYIDGYVESVECDPWTLGQVMQVSIICPQPFFMDISATYTDASAVASAFEFPFSIEAEGVELSTFDLAAETVIDNAGHVSTGCIFELRARLRSLQPRIYNVETGEFIGVLVDMFPGEVLRINTTTGQKSITLVQNGVETNYLNRIMSGSKWLQLQPGQNTISYTVDEGECTLTVIHTNMYQGV